MKIKLLFLFMLCFSLVAEAQSQEMITYTHSARYKKSHKIDSLQKDYTIENFILLFNDKQSAFRSIPRYLLDSINRDEDFQNLPQMQRVAITSQYPSYNEELLQINLDTKEVTLTTYASVMPSVNPRYKDTVTLQWTINDEVKKIKGYDCKKAETRLFGRKWTAWFATAYPYPVGPYKFHGLPGLIIQLEDSTGSYKFELYQFKVKDVVYPSTVHNDVQLVSKEEFKKIYESGRYGMSLFTGVLMDEYRTERIKEVKNNLKQSENNPIELIP